MAESKDRAPSSQFVALPSEDEMVQKARLLSGELPSEGEIALVTVVRDAGFLMPSWLEHHRSLGVDRFLVLDDGSSTEFLHFLAQEPDVSVFGLPFRFGETVSWQDASGVVRSGRAGNVYKELFGNKVCPGNINFVLDIDEFLVIHPDFCSIRDLLNHFEETTATIFPAQMVDMLPTSWPPASFNRKPPGFDELVTAHPMFFPQPAWSRDGAGFEWKWRVNGITKLFERYRVFSGRGFKYVVRWFLWWVLPKRWAFPRTDVNKLPFLIGQSAQDRRGAHYSVEPPNAPFVMAVLHFTMTHQLEEKIAFALSDQGGYGISQSRYRSLGRLIKKIRNSGSLETVFRDDFARYLGPESLVNAGILEDYRLQ